MWYSQMWRARCNFWHGNSEVPAPASMHTETGVKSVELNILIALKALATCYAR
jgi:hypothetical protein